MAQAELMGNDGRVTIVTVLRRGASNSRVKFADGHSELVSTGLIRLLDAGTSSSNTPGSSRRLLVPETPLRRFYRSIDFGGNPADRFALLQQRLERTHGPAGAEFLAELFVRSEGAMSYYDNDEPSFFPKKGRTLERKDNSGARLLVDFVAAGAMEFAKECPQFSYVSREVCPLRTLQSCFEDGTSATSSGSGGCDLLLLSERKQLLPAVGEIKAATEQVGLTFALIQGLVYAAELASTSQWRRLGRAFPLLQNVCTAQLRPCLDVVILCQYSPQGKRLPDDRDLALRLAEQLQADPTMSSIRHIDFIEWSLKSDRAVLSRVCRL
jgi:hypothetical protein